MQRFLPLLALLFLACGHLRPPAPADPSAYGYSMATSIEVCGPRGETAYLSRLRCANGARPKFSRTGSYGSRTPIPAERRQDPDMIKEIMGPVGPGRPDYHVIDGYRVECESLMPMLYLDMYHCEAEPARAPDGYTLESSALR